MFQGHAVSSSRDSPHFMLDGHMWIIKLVCDKTVIWFYQEAPDPETQLQCLVLRMLTDFTLMYTACVGVLLKRDAEAMSGTLGKRFEADVAGLAGGSSPARIPPGLSLIRYQRTSQAYGAEELSCLRLSSFFGLCGYGWSIAAMSIYLV